MYLHITCLCLRCAYPLITSNNNMNTLAKQKKDSLVISNDWHRADIVAALHKKG